MMRYSLSLAIALLQLTSVCSFIQVVHNLSPLRTLSVRFHDAQRGDGLFMKTVKDDDALPDQRVAVDLPHTPKI